MISAHNLYLLLGGARGCVATPKDSRDGARFHPGGLGDGRGRKGILLAEEGAGGEAVQAKASQDDIR